MTLLEQKLNQLSLSTMSRQLETTLTDAAAKNLSAAATLEWLADMTIATAIADRLVENSEIFLLGGDSLRKANKNPDPPAE
jgi:DNA replication protein DnaC